jgi:hypothetical protein
MDLRSESRWLLELGIINYNHFLAGHSSPAAFTKSTRSNSMLNGNGEHVTRDGEIIPLRDLTDSHLVNIINYIEKRSREGFYVSMISCWNPADPDSMCYQVAFRICTWC